MSIYWYRWAKSQKQLRPPEKAVLVCIADYYNDKEDCAWPCQDTLAEDTGYNRSTVHRACKSLKEKGLLSWKSNMRFSGHFSSNRYQLHRVADCQAAECTVAYKDSAMLHKASSPCGTEQQKPLAEPLDLTLKLQKAEKKRKELTKSQCKLAEIWARELVSKFPGEYFELGQIIRDCEDFLKSDQTNECWEKIGNGLPNPSKALK